MTSPQAEREMIAEAEESSTAHGADRTFVTRFERRARVHGLLAGLVFILIAALVAFAGYVFFFAASITSRDFQRDQSVYALDRDSIVMLESTVAAHKALLDIYMRQFEVGQRDLLDLVRVERDLNFAKRRLTLAKARVDAGRPIGTDLDQPNIKSNEELQATIELLQEQKKSLEKVLELAKEIEIAGGASMEQSTVVSMLLESTQLEINLLKSQKLRIDGDEKKGLEIQGIELENYGALIQTSVTRFGTMIVVFFFISILVPLYRYNMRLAVFYNSVADALLLSQQHTDLSLVELAPVLFPTWGFDAPPETPTQQAAQMFERIAGAAKRV